MARNFPIPTWNASATRTLTFDRQPNLLVLLPLHFYRLWTRLSNMAERTTK